MGCFDGWLICSDYDNTLTANCDMRTDGILPEENLAAIRAFRQEGGRFVICSGRTAPGVMRLDPLLSADGFIIANNGSVLYEKATDRVLRVIPVKDWMEVLDEALRVGTGSIEKYGVFRLNGAQFFARGDDPFRPEPGDDENDPVTKLVFLHDGEEQALAMWRSVEARFGGKYRYNRAYRDDLEILDSASGKGTLALELKQRLGARMLVGVGDYENDLDLLTAADLSFAPSTALESVRRAADVVLDAETGGIFPALVAYLRRQAEA